MGQAKRIRKGRMLEKKIREGRKRLEKNIILGIAYGMGQEKIRGAIYLSLLERGIRPRIARKILSMMESRLRGMPSRGIRPRIARKIFSMMESRLRGMPSWRMGRGTGVIPPRYDEIFFEGTKWLDENG